MWQLIKVSLSAMFCYLFAIHVAYCWSFFHRVLEKAIEIEAFSWVLIKCLQSITRDWIDINDRYEMKENRGYKCYFMNCIWLWNINNTALFPHFTSALEQCVASDEEYIIRFYVLVLCRKGLLSTLISPNSWRTQNSIILLRMLHFLTYLFYCRCSRGYDMQSKISTKSKLIQTINSLMHLS